MYDKEITFEEFINAFKKTLFTFDYYIDWNSINKTLDFETNMKLNLLNSLVGSDNIEEKLRELLMQYPDVITVFPLLIAASKTDKEYYSFFVRDIFNETDTFAYKIYNFPNSKYNKYEKIEHLTPDEIESAIEFLDGIKILELLNDKKIKDLADYVTGVLVGQDTNGRKNRSGKLMQDLVKT